MVLQLWLDLHNAIFWFSMWDRWTLMSLKAWYKKCTKLKKQVHKFPTKKRNGNFQSMRLWQLKCWICVKQSIEVLEYNCPSQWKFLNTARATRAFVYHARKQEMKLNGWHLNCVAEYSRVAISSLCYLVQSPVPWKWGILYTCEINYKAQRYKLRTYPQSYMYRECCFTSADAIAAILCSLAL